MSMLRKSKAKNVNPITLFLIILISSFLVFLVNGTSYYALLGMSFVVVLTFSYLEVIKRGCIYLGLYLLLKILAHILSRCLHPNYPDPQRFTNTAAKATAKLPKKGNEHPLIAIPVRVRCLRLATGLR